MRKILMYTLLFLLAAAFYFFFWENLTDLWKKVSLLGFGTLLFFAIKDILLYAFDFFAHTFSSLFHYLVAALAFVGVVLFGYNNLSDGGVKNTMQEMGNDTKEFFSLPPLQDEFSGTDVVTVESTKEAGRALQKASSEEIERVMETQPSPFLISGSVSDTQNNEENTEPSVDPLIQLLSDPVDTEGNTDVVQMEDSQDQSESNNTIDNNEDAVSTSTTQLLQDSLVFAKAGIESSADTISVSDLTANNTSEDTSENMAGNAIESESESTEGVSATENDSEGADNSSTTAEEKSNTEEDSENTKELVVSLQNSDGNSDKNTENTNEEGGDENDENANKNEDTNAGSTDESSSVEDTMVTALEFENDSEQNWKKPVIQFIDTPTPLPGSEVVSQPVSLSGDDTSVVVAVSTAPTPTPVFSPVLSNSGAKLPSSGERDEKFIIQFRSLPVQMVYPVEYSVSNAVWTDTDDTLDSVDFTLTLPKGIQSQIRVEIMDSGELYSKYEPYFLNEYSQTENLFFLESTTPKSATYVSFFGGNLWSITVALPDSVYPSLDDFYDILLPVVFEAQE